MSPADDQSTASHLVDLRVMCAQIDGNVKAILGRLEAHDKGHEDHETRLRGLERSAACVGTAAVCVDHETRMRAVERRLWAIPSLAALLGIAALIVSIWTKAS